MKKPAVAILLMLSCSGPACAAPEVIQMKNRITFNHRDHMTAMGGCRGCHSRTIGKLAEFRGKNGAHENCKGCHQTLGSGPVKCSGCHKWGN